MYTTSERWENSPAAIIEGNYEIVMIIKWKKETAKNK
jgi:hypothetical protein